MKNIKTLATLFASALLLTCVTAPAFATASYMTLSGCARAICEKEQELEEARNFNDISKILGIQNSLVHLRADCTQMPAGASSKFNAKLAGQKEEYREDLEEAFNEYQDDLEEAQREGKPAKVQQAEQKYHQKIFSKTDKYQQKQAQLNTTFGY